ncbi:HupE/UreJ family protein [Tropicibacter sp. Alg240-R139]|uniref:HupE/UreJ family protein n=1 Tax=Tropicibacter sp. Alg240-R139 TaxID=2305991 RepID=UPI0013DEE45A|nr:HupE/UreJ family protein [Tropicibacter sp. Alg240-R139]
MLAVLFVGSLAPSLVNAHTLGVDKGELRALGDNAYRLASKVPPLLAAAITTPVLPSHCGFDGSPGGVRGADTVTFTFSCSGPLTASDEIHLPWQRDGVMLTAIWEDGSQVTEFLPREGQTIVVSLDVFKASSGGWARAAWRYLVLGFEHILLGLDHLLFVLALLIMTDTTWRLVKTITGFTIAHSITLGLATLGFLSIPGGPVEAAIALSIVFLCAEIIYARRGHPGLTYRFPWMVAFGFGLLHGLGFAGALSEIGLPPGEVPVALLFFNVGVELGQLAFVLCILVLLKSAMCLSKVWAARVRIAIVYVVGCVAAFWFVERTASLLSGFS